MAQMVQYLSRPTGNPPVFNDSIKLWTTDSTPPDLFNIPVPDCTTTNIVLGIPLSYCSGPMDVRARILAPHLATLFQTIGFTGNCPPISLIRENAQPYHDRPPGTLPTAGTHSIYLLNVGTSDMVIAACSLQPPQDSYPHPVLTLSPQAVMYIAPGGRHSFLADPNGAPLDVSRRNYTTLIRVAMEETTTIHDVLLKHPHLDDIACTAKLKQENWTRRQEEIAAQHALKRPPPNDQPPRRFQRKKPIPIFFPRCCQ
eukprot:gene31958-16097_t